MAKLKTPADVDMQTQKITNLVDPIANQEAATKKYVDDEDASADTHTAGDGSDHADVATNSAARHTQNTDTALGSGAVAADHGAAATDQIINVSYGTGAAPAANTTTIGSIYIKYTA